ncbi:MAG: hypothetical protein JW940_08920 [Polyangiaceae bacterium]|nr:hypothetical protein [Polyangiaceae bacterium]
MSVFLQRSKRSSVGTVAACLHSLRKSITGLSWVVTVGVVLIVRGCSSSNSSSGSNRDPDGSGGQTSCAGGLEDCSGQCVDTLTSPTSCGECGKACAAGQTCVSGQCSSTGAGGSSGSGNSSTMGGSTDTGGPATGGSGDTGGATTGSLNDTGGSTDAVGTNATGGRTGQGGRTGAGGAAAGDAATGGSVAGGAASGGSSSATGGSDTGGRAGGTDTGGRATGGSATGGSAAGGAATGGSGTGGASDCQPFSFFVTSYEAIKRESGSDDGFGGDLGGLAGADEICRKIAEFVLPCAGQKPWKAFLSTSNEDAIDRVGNGPWYDFMGRTVAKTKEDLASERPNNCDPAIVNDLPNEFGVPNHDPDGTGEVDNHDMLTGSNAQGRYAGAQATCNDWTSVGSGNPVVGHAWPEGPSRNWVSAYNAPGCAAGTFLGNSSGRCVGCVAGYGGWYCFALTP